MALAIASLLAAAANAGLSMYANQKSQESMQRYRNALAADRARAAQKEDYLENVDPLHTKSGQALSTDMGEKLRDVNEAAAGRNAVMGGGGHNTAATKDVTSQLMAQYQRSLIRQHEMNTVPQLQYYRSQYDKANAGLEKAEYDRSVANINAASTAAQGMINGLAAAGSQAGEKSATDALNNATNAVNGNGTAVGELKSALTPTSVTSDTIAATPSYPDKLDPNKKVFTRDATVAANAIPASPLPTTAAYPAEAPSESPFDPYKNWLSEHGG